MSRLTGLLDDEARAYFEAIEAAVRPGRHQPEDAAPEQCDTRNPAQRCHDALKLGLKTAIGSGELGTHRGHPVTVVVTTALAELDRAAHAAVDESVPMPPPALTGGGFAVADARSDPHGRPRDPLLRRKREVPPRGVRRPYRPAAVSGPPKTHRHRRPAAHLLLARPRLHPPHCLVPGYRCEVHHSPDWAAGGQTDADKLFSRAVATTTAPHGALFSTPR